MRLDLLGKPYRDALNGSQLSQSLARKRLSGGHGYKLLQDAAPLNSHALLQFE
jgi:hypothetical protein